MTQPHTALLERIIAYTGNDARRLNHLVKVTGYAVYIGESEGLDGKTLETLRLAALLHDIGIKESERKYGSGAGNYQQIEGPPVARELMAGLDIADDVRERICFLIAHHHTYDDIQGGDYRILVEADFIVNIFEGEMKRPEIDRVRETIFRTAAGTKLLDTLYRA